VSWTTESGFSKMLVNVLFLDIMRVVNSLVALAFDGGVWCQNHTLATLSLLPGVWVGLKADMDVVVKIAACVKN